MNGQCLASETNKDLVNPFVHHLELTTTYEKIKAGILTVLVLPVRLMIICGLLVLAWLLACVGLFGLSEKDLQERPLAPWRRRVRWYSGRLIRGILFCMGFHRVHFRGQKVSRFRAPLLILAPHSTFFDALPIICMGDVSVVTAMENLKIPFIGKLINFTQPMYVWRDDPNSRQKTIQQIKDRANSSLDWSQILIFPEGTCTNRSCLITFKPGAFYPGVPVQPVILRYPNKLDTVTWTWDGPGALKLMWLTLVQPHSNCEIEFLPVYKPSKEERKDPKLYAENVRQLMARALGVPTINYTYDDCQLVAKANTLSIPRTCRILQILKHRIRLGLTRSHREAKLASEEPKQLQNEQPVNFTEFTERLNIPSADPVSRDLFSLLDQDASGTADFSLYLLSVLMVDRASSHSDMLDMAFQLCGRHGKLDERQVAGLLRQVYQLSPTDAAQLSRDIVSSSSSSDEQLVSLSHFESYMKKRPDLRLVNNNNGGHDKRD